jgi:tRNA modification GTPase
MAIDDGLCLWFPAPASYTGEDVVELHLHGGPAIVAATLEALGRWPGCRMAEPGEFTRRAFLNGKLDLTEAEGVADLIVAETEAQRRQALQQSRGALGALYDGWRGRLMRSLAHLEAVIDFPEEGLPDSVMESSVREISAMSDEVAQHLDDGRIGERLREGVHIAIVGPPNAGKSSLLNLLARREAAIVAETAGTTRDVIEVRLDLGGYPVLLADTAGIREAAGTVEAEGVRRARERAASADIRIAVFDAVAPVPADSVTYVDAATLTVANKIDLGGSGSAVPTGGLGRYPVSVRDGTGVDAFMAGLQAIVADRFDAGGAAVITRARHREALADCATALRRARTAEFPELRAEDLRLATRCLGRITGVVDVEDLLDIIFRDFCIGK